MKRATFKKPFNGMDNALKLIPESYKVDGNEFQITDGVETYDIRWDINEATVLRAENKNLINEDLKKMKHLMGFKSQDTLGTLKGEQRIVENKSFGDVWNKTKKLLNEAEEEDSTIAEQAFGMGFSNEGNLEGNEPIAEMEKEEVEEGSQVKLAAAGSQYDDEGNAIDASGEKIYKEGELEENDVDNFMDAMGQNQKLGSLASKINTRDEKVEAALGFVRDLTGGDEAITAKIARALMKGDVTADAANAAMAGNQNEGEMCEECGDEMPEAPSHEETDANQVYEDEFDRIFEDMYLEEEEELSPEQSKEMDTDKDGDIDAKDLENLRKGKDE